MSLLTLPPHSLLLITGATLAGFAQGLSGFAFGMVAMSVWVWSIDPHIASVMAVFGGLTGQLFTALSTRRNLHLNVLLPFLIGAAVGVPIGVILLPHINAVQFKLIFGLLFVLWCPSMLFAKQLPNINGGGKFADALVGTAGGVMGGISGFTGALPTLWCILRGYNKDLQRTVIQNFNLAALTATMVAYVVSGTVTREMLPMFAVVGPALLIPSLLGSRMYIGLSEQAFRQIVLMLLTACGIAMLAASVPQLLN